MLSGLLVVSVPDSMTSMALGALPLMSVAGSMPVVSSTPGGTTPISGMSSLASLLATPLRGLGPAPVGRAVPLVLSSALPPVPARAVHKIRSGLFIDFKELLPNNVALSQRLAETSSLLSGAPPARLREVTDILTWISCYLYFVAARSEDSATRDMASLSSISPANMAAGIGCYTMQPSANRWQRDLCWHG